MYDVEKKSWQRVADLPSKRAFAAACLLDDVVYVAGGWDGSTNTTYDVVDCYSVATNMWQRAPNMSTRRSGHALVACGSRLFAFGGSDEKNKKLKTAEQFDAAQRKWVAIASMEVVRYAVAGCALGVSSAWRTCTS
jgi:N-acetylneuraminic acid mutarotase